MTDNKTPRTICLQGEPGSGKSRMAGLTAINKPVHFIDIDRKIAAAAWAQSAIASKMLTFKELIEPFDDTNIKSRIRSLASAIAKEKPAVQPKGWETIAEMIYDLPKCEDGKRAGTWVIDSITMANEHLKTMIMYYAGRSKYTFDQWNALKIGWMDTMDVLRNLAKSNGKDLIVTVHERYKEEPGDRVTGARMEPVKSGDDIVMQKVYIGVQDVKVWASVDGSFGDLIGVFADEYYWLYIDNKGDKPAWKCRVHPDGKRSLRTSFDLKEDVYEPDFARIWK